MGRLNPARVAALDGSLKELGTERSLVRMSAKAAARSAAAIMDVGDAPFRLVIPILRCVEDPDQLSYLESGFHLQPDEKPVMADIWTKLLENKFPKWETRYHIKLEESMSGYDMYKLISEESDRQLATAEAALKQQLEGFDKVKKDNRTHIVKPSLLPRMPGGRRRGGGSGGSPSLAGGSRTKMTDGRSVLMRARREAIEIVRAKALNARNVEARTRPNQIRKAPEAMVNEYRIASNPKVKVHVPRRGAAARPNPEQGLRESRLLSIKNSTAAKKTPAPAANDESRGDNRSLLYDTSKKRASPDEDQDDLDDLDDLFDNRPQKRTRVDADPATPPRKSVGLLSNKHRITPRPNVRQTTNTPHIPEPVKSALKSLTKNPPVTATKAAPSTPVSAEKRAAALARAREGIRKPRPNDLGVVVPRSRSQTPASSQGSRPATPTSATSPLAVAALRSLPESSPARRPPPQPTATTPKTSQPRPRSLVKRQTDIMRPNRVTR